MKRWGKRGGERGGDAFFKYDLRSILKNFIRGGKMEKEGQREGFEGAKSKRGQNRLQFGNCGDN